MLARTRADTCQMRVDSSKIELGQARGQTEMSVDKHKQVGMSDFAK